MKIDNYALTMFQTCPAKYDLRMRQNWSSRGKSSALGFGGALHEGLAAWHKTRDLQKALSAISDYWAKVCEGQVPSDDYRNEGKALEVMYEYTKEYPNEPWSVVGWPDDPMVEVSFTLDTGMFLSCQSCSGGPAFDSADGICPNCNEPLEPIEYGGIFDGLIDFSGVVYVLEHKTTSVMGGRYFNQFKPNNQITGYVWATKHLTGKKVGGAYINALGIYKSQKTKFERAVSTRTPDEIQEWLSNVKATCEAIKFCERTGHWQMHTPACTLYGACEFYNVHTLSDDDSRQRHLEQNFIRSVWDYEDRD